MEIIDRNEKVIDVTFSTDTNIYASGDLIADTQVLTQVRAKRQIVQLKSIVLIDRADQKSALSVVFLATNTSLGSENSAPNISDDDATSALVAHVDIAAADYIDLGGAAMATKRVDLPLELADGVSHLYVALVSAGTPTYAADSLRGRFYFER